MIVSFWQSTPLSNISVISWKVASSQGPCIIVTHSHAALSTIVHPHSSHPLVKGIQILWSTLSSAHTKFIFCRCRDIWELPATKELTMLSNRSMNAPKSIQSYIPTRSDLSHLIFKSIHYVWLTKEQDFHPTNKLAALRRTATPCPSSNQSSRKIGTILTCLYIGHTRLTQTHLFTIVRKNKNHFNSCINTHPAF